MVVLIKAKNLVRSMRRADYLDENDNIVLSNIITMIGSDIDTMYNAWGVTCSVVSNCVVSNKAIVFYCDLVPFPILRKISKVIRHKLKVYVFNDLYSCHAYKYIMLNGHICKSKTLGFNDTARLKSKYNYFIYPRYSKDEIYEMVKNEIGYKEKI